MARSSVRAFVNEYCGLVSPTTARCHCRQRVPAAVRLGRVDPAISDGASRRDIDDAVAEMETLYDAAGLLRSVPDAVAPDELLVRIRQLLDSGRSTLVTPGERGQ